MTGTVIDIVARLDAIEQLKQLKALYFYHLDMKDWPAWRDVFTDDAVLDVKSHLPEGVAGETMTISGGDAIVRDVSRYIGDAVTVHHGHTPIIELTGEDAATGLWAMEDNVFTSAGRLMIGHGHYRETYRRDGGRWRISHVTLTRLAYRVEDAVTS